MRQFQIVFMTEEGLRAEIVRAEHKDAIAQLDKRDIREISQFGETPKPNKVYRGRFKRAFVIAS